MEARRTPRRYDHRFREVVRQTGDVELAVQQGVPLSTARDWSLLDSPEVITLDVLSMSECELRKEVVELRKRHARLLAILRLFVVLVKVLECGLCHRLVPDGEKKRLILRAVDRSKDVLSLRSELLVLGLSKTRYYDWRREEDGHLKLTHLESKIRDTAGVVVEEKSHSFLEERMLEVSQVAEM